jgi:DNA-binding GntR family transcriptional regulator
MSLRTNHGQLQRTSLSGAAYLALRQRILDLDLPPGTRLVPEELAGQLGVSRTPVRDALSLLARDLLVEFAPNGTARVALPSASYVEAVTDVRKLLEGWACGQAATRISPWQVASLRAQWAAAVDRLRHEGDATILGEVDEALHQAVADACGNVAIVQVLAPISDYRTWLRQIGVRQGRSARGNLDEHDAILTALEKHDAERAREAMIAHIEAGRQRQLAVIAAVTGEAKSDEVSPTSAV